MKKAIILIFLLVTIIQCKSPINQEEIGSEPTNKVVLSSDINWEALNPARGDKSPKAGTIWGDRKGKVPAGFLVRFKDGFSSPPHIHNVSYRALVIDGLIHNDDASAEKMWMPSGSFWTQPAGESHITATKGEDNLIYVEIDSGPYLVKPTDEAFDNGERPVNIDVSNLVWLNAEKTSLIKESNERIKNAEIAFLWKKDGLEGNLIKLPENFTGKIYSYGSIFQAVVIKGNPTYQIPNALEEENLDPGSSFTSHGVSIHEINSEKNKETLIYVRTNGTFSIVKN